MSTFLLPLSHPPPSILPLLLASLLTLCPSPYMDTSSSHPYPHQSSPPLSLSGGRGYLIIIYRVA